MTPQAFKDMMLPPLQIVEYTDKETGEVEQDHQLSRRLPVAVIKITQWRRKFTGCDLIEQMKLITFAHKKRLHNLDDNTSRPFRTLAEQIKYSTKVDYKMKILKEHERNTNVQIKEVLEQIKTTGSYFIGRKGDSYQARLHG